MCAGRYRSQLAIRQRTRSRPEWWLHSHPRLCKGCVMLDGCTGRGLSRVACLVGPHFSSDPPIPTASTDESAEGYVLVAQAGEVSPSCCGYFSCSWVPPRLSLTCPCRPGGPKQTSRVGGLLRFLCLSHWRERRKSTSKQHEVSTADKLAAFMAVYV